jgi:hypothetical protein
LLQTTQQHVYYTVHENADLIIVHTVWGARRGREQLTQLESELANATANRRPSNADWPKSRTPFTPQRSLW